jgi:hypothetical protein
MTIPSSSVGDIVLLALLPKVDCRHFKDALKVNSRICSVVPKVRHKVNHVLVGSSASILKLIGEQRFPCPFNATVFDGFHCLFSRPINE